jgi:hypothetical protein
MEFAVVSHYCQSRLALCHRFLTRRLVYLTPRRPVKPLETRGLEPLTYALQRHRSPG